MEEFLQLTEDESNQLPWIPDDVDAIELSEELIKAGLIGRIAGLAEQVWQGRPGRWITTNTGRKIFIYLDKLSDKDLVALQTGELGRAVNLMHGIPNPNKFDPRISRFGSSSGKQIIDIVGDGRGFFKPESALSPIGGGIKNEIAAYRISSILGLDIVPATTFRTINGVNGSFQTVVPGRSLYVAGKVDTLGDLIGSGGMSDDFLLKASMFDYLIMTTDRHAGNIMLSTKGKYWLVDHSDTLLRSKTLTNHHSILSDYVGFKHGIDMSPLVSWESKWPKIDRMLKTMNYETKYYYNSMYEGTNIRKRFEHIVDAADAKMTTRDFWHDIKDRVVQ